MIALRLTVRGRVQGVFYRDWTVENAQALGLTGWVRNEADGTVEALVQGGEEVVRQMIEWMRIGPPRAQVERIEQQECGQEELENFGRR